jgi:hypothetical protein
MSEYHKINTIFKRDMSRKDKPLIMGDWSEDVFGYLADNVWVATEKVDGTNIRVMVDPAFGVSFGGRTDAAQIPAKLVARLQERFLPQADKLQETFSEGAVLYGEGYGASIQKGGGNYRADQDFVLFDVRVGDWWLERTNVEGIAKTFGLDVVPMVGVGTLHDMVEAVRTGMKSRWGDFIAEGIVARPRVELKSRGGHRIIAKIKHRDFVQSGTA